MKNPAPVYRFMFIAAMGFLLVGILFTMTAIPAAELFSTIGGLAVLTLYGLFSKAAVRNPKSTYPRHLAIASLVIGQILKSFDIAAGAYLLLVALVAILVWITWSVLEKLPPSEQ